VWRISKSSSAIFAGCSKTRNRIPDLLCLSFTYYQVKGGSNMSKSKGPWPHPPRRPLPPLHERKQLQTYLHKLFSEENMASLEKMLRADPRLVAFARELAKKGVPS
jgi:hypothetical protein